jgi:hypothetical protein
VRLRNLENIQQKSQYHPVVLEVYSPSNKCMVVGQHPHISHKMDMPWVLLKKIGYTLMALLVSQLDITLNSVWRWNFEVGVSSCEEVNKLGIVDNCCRAIVFSYPLCNMGSDIYELMKSDITIILTET